MIKGFEIRNFQSWDLLVFNIDLGITLIQGHNYDDDNDEGAGKSAIPNAICWLAYGEIPKELNVDEVIRRGQKCCSGRLNLDHSLYQAIGRSRNPNLVYLINHNGEKVIGKDAKETQEMIDDVLGLSYKAFIVSCYFSQNPNTKFMPALPARKAEILSEISNLQVFDKAYKKAHELLKGEKTSYDSLKVILNAAIVEREHIGELMGIVDKRIKEREETAKRKVTEIEIRIKEIQEYIIRDETEIEQLRGKIRNENHTKGLVEQWESDKTLEEARRQEILVSISSIDEKKKFKIKLQRTKQGKIQDLEKLAKEYDKLETFIVNPTKTCPTCGTLLENADTTHARLELVEVTKNIEELGAELDSLEAQIKTEPDYDLTQLQSELAKIDCNIKNIKASLKLYNDDLNKIQTVKANIEYLSKQNAKNRENLIIFVNSLDSAKEVLVDDLIDEKANYLEKLDSCLEKTEVTEALLKEKSTYMDRLDTLKSGYKEVKNYVFNSSLGELSRKLNKYAFSLFEMPVKVKFNNDEMKITTSINLNGQECSLGTLSGGQCSRISLAGDLALAEMVSARNSNLSIAIFDEPFQNLSESSMEKCITLFKQLNKPTIIIEHNSIAKTIVDKTFTCELRDKVSREI